MGKTNPNFFREFRKEIIELFNRDDFFNVKIPILKIWSKIIDLFLDVTRIDLMKEYLIK